MSKAGKSVNVINKGGPLGFVFFAAWVGALVYFVQRSNGFWGFIVAFLKACVWPAYVMHHVLVLLRV